MDDRESVLLPEGLQRRHAGVQAEEAVEIERSAVATAPRLGNRDRRPRRVVRPLAERHHHVEAVDGPALEDRDQDLAALRTGGRGTRDEAGREPEADERQPTISQEDASGNHLSLRPWAVGQRR